MINADYAYAVIVTALPVEHGDPLDPVRILADLPEAEPPFFAAQYREPAEAARDPAGWQALHCGPG